MLVEEIAQTLSQVVPEYERAVIFRLGRLSDREAKGPGNKLTYAVVC